MSKSGLMRVVLDTSVLVAAARSRNGASHALLSQLSGGGFEPAISVPTFVEYRAVLLRPENLLGRPRSEPKVGVTRSRQREGLLRQKSVLPDFLSH